jgi:hypothetical protein
LNAEVTFEIVDISPDGKWVRFEHHKGSMDKGTYIDIDKINSQTVSMGWDKYGYSGANSTKMSQVSKNIYSGFWKRVNVPGYLQKNPEEYDRLLKLGSNITESNDFDWIVDIPEADEYRFFDVYTCGDNQYDEETGEDECLDGGSYFLRIPKKEVEEIWDLEVGDMGGPGDEGAGVIEWGVKNGKFDPREFVRVEYVMELSKKEFCREGWSFYPDTCGDFINESTEFDWADEVQGKPQVMDIFRVKNTRYTWTVVEELEGDKFMFKIRPKPDSGSAFQELSLETINRHLQTGNWVPEGREKYWYNLR